MKQKFFIPETLPGMNDIVSDRLKFRTVKAKSGRKFRISRYDDVKKRVEAKICACIKSSLIEPMSLVNASFLWIEPNRKRDKDNISTGKKFIFDALVAMKIIKTDGWRCVNSFSDEFIVEKNKPGVMVTLTEHEG